MSELTALETSILDQVWNCHVYFVHKRFKYSQPVLDWAIKESGNTLDRDRIKVTIVSLELMRRGQRYLRNRRRYNSSLLKAEFMRRNAEDCESKFTSAFQPKVPSELNTLPSRKLPAEDIPAFQSLRTSLMNKVEFQSATMELTRDIFQSSPLDY